jgi:hypothetical protein
MSLLLCYVAISYGCCSCCNYSTRVEKEKKIVATQNTRNQQIKETQETQNQKKFAAFNTK